MKKLIAFLRREPAMVAAVLGAAFTEAAARGLSLSDADEALITSLAFLALGIGVRQQVTPMATLVPKVVAAGNSPEAVQAFEAGVKEWRKKVKKNR